MFEIFHVQVRLNVVNSLCYYFNPLLNKVKCLMTIAHTNGSSAC